MTTYTNQLRIGAAAQLLANSNLRVLDIGFRAGFGNDFNFNRQFKGMKGVAPRGRCAVSFKGRRRQLLTEKYETIHQTVKWRIVMN
jgi:transcriptional regulator GlxA family with amidase domain